MKGACTTLFFKFLSFNVLSSDAAHSSSWGFHSLPDCPSTKRGDLVCDFECNRRAFDYDEGDCCPSDCKAENACNIDLPYYWNSYRRGTRASIRREAKLIEQYKLEKYNALTGRDVSFDISQSTNSRGEVRAWNYWKYPRSGKHFIEWQMSICRNPNSVDISSLIKYTHSYYPAGVAFVWLVVLLHALLCLLWKPVRGISSAAIKPVKQHHLYSDEVVDKGTDILDAETAVEHISLGALFLKPGFGLVILGGLLFAMEYLAGVYLIHEVSGRAAHVNGAPDSGFLIFPGTVALPKGIRFGRHIYFGGDILAKLIILPVATSVLGAIGTLASCRALSSWQKLYLSFLSTISLHVLQIGFYALASRPGSPRRIELNALLLRVQWVRIAAGSFPSLFLGGIYYFSLRLMREENSRPDENVGWANPSVGHSTGFCILDDRSIVAALFMSVLVVSFTIAREASSRVHIARLSSRELIGLAMYITLDILFLLLATFELTQRFKGIGTMIGISGLVQLLGKMIVPVIESNFPQFRLNSLIQIVKNIIKSIPFCFVDMFLVTKPSTFANDSIVLQQYVVRHVLATIVVLSPFFVRRSPDRKRYTFHIETDTTSSRALLLMFIIVAREFTALYFLRRLGYASIDISTNLAANCRIYANFAAVCLFASSALFFFVLNGLLFSTFDIHQAHIFLAAVLWVAIFPGFFISACSNRQLAYCEMADDQLDHTLSNEVKEPKTINIFDTDPELLGKDFEDRASCYIDLGSGQTMIYLLAIADDASLHYDLIFEDKGCFIDKDDITRGQARLRYIEKLSVVVEKLEQYPGLSIQNLFQVFVGATAKYRVIHTETPERVDAVEEWFQSVIADSKLGNSRGDSLLVDFHIISGTDEARYEWIAIKEACIDGLQVPDCACSAGNGSLQVSMDDKFLTVDCSLKNGADFVKKHGVGRYEEIITKDIDEAFASVGETLKQLRSARNKPLRLVIISSFYYAALACRATIKGEPIQYRDISKLIGSIKSLLESPDTDDSKLHKNKANNVRLLKVLKTVTQTNFENVEVLIVREWSVRGREYKASWTTGRFIETIRNKLYGCEALSIEAKLKHSLYMTQFAWVAPKPNTFQKLCAIKSKASRSDIHLRIDAGYFYDIVESAIFTEQVAANQDVFKTFCCVMDELLKLPPGEVMRWHMRQISDTLQNYVPSIEGSEGELWLLKGLKTKLFDLREAAASNATISSKSYELQGQSSYIALDVTEYETRVIPLASAIDPNIWKAPSPTSPLESSDYRSAFSLSSLLAQDSRAPRKRRADGPLEDPGYLFVSHNWRDDGEEKVKLLTLFLFWEKYSANTTLLILFVCLSFIPVSVIIGEALYEHTYSLSSVAKELSSFSLSILALVVGCIIIVYVRLTKNKDGPLSICQTSLWVDRCCIDQINSESKSRGMKQIYRYVSDANKFVVLFSEAYLCSLWCMFELACFCKTHPDVFDVDCRSLVFLPLNESTKKDNLAVEILQVPRKLCSWSSFKAFIIHVLQMTSKWCLHTKAMLHCRWKEVGITPEQNAMLRSFSCRRAHISIPCDRAIVLSEIRRIWGSEEAFDDYVQSKIPIALKLGKSRHRQHWKIAIADAYRFLSGEWDFIVE